MGVEWNSLPSVSVCRREMLLASCFHTFSAAPALATAKLTPSIALAPSLVLLGVLDMVGISTTSTSHEPDIAENLSAKILYSCDAPHISHWDKSNAIEA